MGKIVKEDPKDLEDSSMDHPSAEETDMKDREELKEWEQELEKREEKLKRWGEELHEKDYISSEVVH